MDWIDLAQDRDQCRVPVNPVINLRVPLKAGKFLSSCTIGDFSRRAQLHERVIIIIIIIIINVVTITELFLNDASLIFFGFYFICIVLVLFHYFIVLTL
jgi:hypothetical protein